MILSQINGIYDPLGLVSPFVVKAKMYLRKLWALEPKLDWDDPIPQSLFKQWIDFFQQMFLLYQLTFNRCARPKHPVGQPMMISFSDASTDAFGACVYVR